MNKSSLLLGAACMALAFPTLAQQASQAVPTVTVSHQLPVTSACPNVMKDLPDRLNKVAWQIGASANVLVKFTLTGSQLSELHTKASDWEFGDQVRRAVRHLRCQIPDQLAYTVQFRVVLKFEDDDNAGSTASIEPDFSPAMARR